MARLKKRAVLVTLLLSTSRPRFGALLGKVEFSCCAGTSWLLAVLPPAQRSCCGSRSGCPQLALPRAGGCPDISRCKLFAVQCVRIPWFLMVSKYGAKGRVLSVSLVLLD